LDNEPKHCGARENAHEGKAGRIDTGLLQGGAAEQGIARKRNHGRERQDEKSCRVHLGFPAKAGILNRG
jgi:hypothetical protein